MNGSAISPTSGMRDAIRLALQGATGPLTVAQVRKALAKPVRLMPGDTQQLLDALVSAGEAHAWGATKSPRFWSRTPAEALPERILQALRDGPLTITPLAKQVAALLPGSTAIDVKSALETLAKTGRVHPHAPVRGSACSFGLLPADLTVHFGKVQEAVDVVCAKVARYGVERERVLGALRRMLGGDAPDAMPAATDLPSAILAVVRLVSYRGVLAISLLRKLLNRPKPEFDSAVLDLKAKGLVLLHAHHGPLALPAEERYELVDDGRGTFYVGVGLR